MPAVEYEARNMVSSLLTFLHHHYGNVIKEFFTKDAPTPGCRFVLG
jgi:hypothetical protein